MGDERLEHAHGLRRRAETQIAAAGWLTARELLQDALAVYRDERDEAGAAACLRGLGDVALKLQEHDQAARHYADALASVRRAGDPILEGDLLYRQADLARALGKREEAADRFHEACRVYAAAGHRRGEAQCLGLLGELGRELEAPRSEVLALYRDAHRIQMEVGDLRGAAVTLTFMAGYLKESDPGAAAAAFVQAARLYEGLGLHHRAEPYLAAARRLDPDHAPPPTPRPPGPWDTDD